MPQDADRPRSRRSLLAAVTGAAAAYAAHAIRRPPRAAAGNSPVYVELGESNTAVSTTSITNQDPGDDAFHVRATGSGTALRVFGDAGVAMRIDAGTNTGLISASESGYGVYASSETGRGVGADSDTGHAIFATSFSSAFSAVVASSRGEQTGVFGYSGPGLPTESPGKTGVYGYAAHDATANGVTGESPDGSAVRAISQSGTGLRGFSNSGYGVYAEAGSSGRALLAEGRVEFTTSGLAAVPVGARSTEVSPGCDVHARSRILCTLESNQGELFIHRVAKDVTGNTFRVVLSAVVADGRKATVAWFVIG